MTLAKSYISDIQKGKIPHCRWTGLAVDRHLKDLKTGKSRGIYFDEAAGERAVEFFSLLKHYKGAFAGQNFILLPWQAFFISTLFGWKRMDGSRRFRYTYLKVARKNGKTTLAAGTCLYGLIADGESAAEIYTAATTKFQASIAFKDAMEIVKIEPHLNNMAETYQSALYIPSTSSTMRPVSSEDKVLDGLNPHIALIDEYHAHRDDGIFNIMKSGMGARRQPLHLTITTAGFNKTSPCFQYEKTCKEILEGIKEDDSQFALIYELDEEEEYLDERNWIKANPSLGYTPSVEFLRQEVIQAKNNPSQLVNLKTKNFNLWTDASKTWIEHRVWQSCHLSEGIPMDHLRRLPCIGAIDLASTKDLTAFTKIWIDAEEQRYYSQTRYFLPKDNMQARVQKDGIRYDVWAEAGWIELTEGNVTDYRYVKQAIYEDCEAYNIEAIGYDRWNSSQLVIECVDELGEEMMIPYGQGFVSMSAPSKEFEMLVHKREFLHDGNPVCSWCLSNVELAIDPAGNIKPDKSKSSEKIDGTVAKIIALGVIMSRKMDLASEGTSNYDTTDQGLFTL